MFRFSLYSFSSSPHKGGKNGDFIMPCVCSGPKKGTKKLLLRHERETLMYFQC